MINSLISSRFVEVTKFIQLTIPLASDKYLDEPWRRQMSWGWTAFDDSRDQLYFEIHTCKVRCFASSKKVLSNDHRNNESLDVHGITWDILLSRNITISFYFNRKYFSHNVFYIVWYRQLRCLRDSLFLEGTTTFIYITYIFSFFIFNFL